MKKLHSLRTIFFGLVLSIAYLTCTPQPAPIGSEELENSDSGNAIVFESDSFKIDLDIPAVPETTGLTDTINESNKYTWDEFAWQTFIALNWPAIEPTAENGYLRGYPDVHKKFIHADSAKALVWETFKEKREVFKHGITKIEDAKPNPWSHPYAYGPDGDIPMGMHQKRLHSSSKITTLDETVQVVSEAIEPYYNDTTIISKGAAIVSRVFRGTQPDTVKRPGNAVRYEVKVNYDFYKYVVDNGLYFDKTAFARSKQRPPVQLPWRTSLPNPGFDFYSQKPAETSYTQGYQIEKVLKAYDDKDKPKGATPPQIGAIHIKAAWAPINEDEKHRFIWREAEYFLSSSKSPTKKERKVGVFGLVGLHIIQRIKAKAPKDRLNKNPLGGTFIFSTWEHRDIRENNKDTKYKIPSKDSIPTTQYTYSNFVNVNTGFGPPPSFDPPFTSPFYVSRLYPILPHTQEANEKFWEQLPEKSVWHNYRLVGTQYKPINIKTDSIVTGTALSPNDPFVPNKKTNPNDVNYQPIYLSNLVIETNLGLQQFQGQPPNLLTVPQFNGSLSQNTTGSFIRTSNHKKFGNIAYMGNPHNMGGCMGCHGVAQLNGYSFSFVLLGGQAGADPDAEIFYSFNDPLGQRNTGKVSDVVQILQANQQFSKFQNNETKTYITKNGSNVVLDSMSNITFLLAAADNRAIAASFNYGDGVYIVDKSGTLFLTALDKPTGTNEKGVEFQTQRSPAAVWYLYNPNDPLSTAYVIQNKDLGFRNAVIRFGKQPAYLSASQNGSQVVTQTIENGKGKTQWSINKLLKILQ